MCLGVPGRVMERDGLDDEFATAIVDFAGLRRRVSVALVPDTRAGDYVIVHAGVAIGVLDEAEATSLLDRIDDLRAELADDSEEAQP